MWNIVALILLILTGGIFALSLGVFLRKLFKEAFKAKIKITEKLGIKCPECGAVEWSNQVCQACGTPFNVSKLIKLEEDNAKLLQNKTDIYEFFRRCQDLIEASEYMQINIMNEDKKAWAFAQLAAATSLAKISLAEINKNSQPTPDLAQDEDGEWR